MRRKRNCDWKKQRRKKNVGVAGESSVPILVFALPGNVWKMTPGHSARSAQRCSARLVPTWSLNMKGFARVDGQNNGKRPTVKMIRPSVINSVLRMINIHIDIH